jgi:hypothetical protein
MFGAGAAERDVAAEVKLIQIGVLESERPIQLEVGELGDDADLDVIEAGLLIIGIDMRASGIERARDLEGGEIYVGVELDIAEVQVAVGHGMIHIDVLIERGALEREVVEEMSVGEIDVVHKFATFTGKGDVNVQATDIDAAVDESVLQLNAIMMKLCVRYLVGQKAA